MTRTTPSPPATESARRQDLHPWWQDPMHSGNPPSALGRPRQRTSIGLATKNGLRRLRAARSVHSFYGEEGRAFRHTIAALFAQGRWLRLLAEMRKAPR